MTHSKDCINRTLELIINALDAAAAEPPDVIEWVERNVILCDGGREGTAIKLRPYQVEPLRQLAQPGRQDVTFVAVEQIGKSEIWRCWLLYRLVNAPCVMLVVYPSEEKAEEVNESTIRPRLKYIPKFRRMLGKKKHVRRGRYSFGPASAHWQGAGSPIISLSATDVILDEVDYWSSVVQRSDDASVSEKARRATSNLKNARKRNRSFADGKTISVCSPTRATGPIWQSFMDGSRGYWHWRCLRCSQLNPSHKTSLLEFDRTAGGEIIESSIRLVCEHCSNRHRETDAKAINKTGDYVHDLPGRSKKSYQVGALATHDVPGLSWSEVARACVAGGFRGTLDDQKYLANSIKGLPYRVNREDSEAAVLLRARAGIPQRPNYTNAILLCGLDSQKDSWFAIRRWLLPNGNTVGAGCVEVATLEDFSRWAPVDGVEPFATIIDDGGPQQKAVASFVAGRTRLGDLIWRYKGETTAAANRGDGRWVFSSNIARYILASHPHYKESLLYKIHSIYATEVPDLWGLPENFEDIYEPRYMSHMAAYRPNLRKYGGEELINWTRGSDQIDYFDAEKMCLVLVDVICKLAAIRTRRNPVPDLFYERMPTGVPEVYLK